MNVRAERLRRIKVRGALGTAALFVAAWVGIAAAGTQATEESPDTASSKGSLESGIWNLVTSQLSDDKSDDEWSFDALTSESFWGGGSDDGERRSSGSSLSSAITGQS